MNYYYCSLNKKKVLIKLFKQNVKGHKVTSEQKIIQKIPKK